MIAASTVWIIAAPLLGGVCAFLLNRRYAALAIIFTVITVYILSLLLAWDVQQAGLSFYKIGGWGSPLGIDFRLDGLSSLMLLSTAFVGIGISVYASGYFDSASSVKGMQTSLFFWPFWLIAWGGLNALFLSGDIFNLYVCLEVMSFASIALVITGSTVDAITAVVRYLLMSLIGSLFYLLGVVFLYSAYGTLDLASLSQAIGQGPEVSIAIVTMLVGILIKAALFPLHVWLPSAHANAPAPVSAILSSLVILAAFYLTTRLWFALFYSALSPYLGQLLGILGVIAIFYSSIHALKQPRLKMLVAYSTAAQVGYMFLLFPLSGSGSGAEVFAWSGGIYFAISHACAKAAVFLFAGSLMYSLGHDQIDKLEGLAVKFPVGMMTFAISGLSLVGLPPSGGFVAKWLLLKAALISGQWWYAVCMLVGSFFTIAYIFRVIEISLRPDTENKNTMKSIPPAMQYSALALSLAALLMGLVASPPLELLKQGRPNSMEWRDSE